MKNKKDKKCPIRVGSLFSYKYTPSTVIVVGEVRMTIKKTDSFSLRICANGNYFKPISLWHLYDIRREEYYFVSKKQLIYENIDVHYE